MHSVLNIIMQTGKIPHLLYISYRANSLEVKLDEYTQNTDSSTPVKSKANIWRLVFL